MKQPTAPIVASLLFAIGPTLVAGQVCLGRTDSDLTLTFRADRLTASPGASLSFSVEPLQRLLLGGGLGWGGRDTGDETPRTVFVVGGGRFQAIGLSLCPFLGWSQTRYAFIDRLEADRGAVAEEDVYFGVEVARGLVKWKDLAVGLRLRSALRLQEREIARRRWAFEEVPPRLVVANEEDDRQLFEESFAILLNRGSLGIVVGLASDDYERPQVSGFVELTWYLGRD